ncbi:hypothetical protein ACETK8_14905 [Brevundimonas staleyi]|uniref:Uncharacterized protein n=2 Tax=Brevundimonas staleyi TaxID=74326 RepID=A0ABW0FV34_9CAUL
MTTAHPEPTYAATAPAAKALRPGARAGARLLGYALAGGFSLIVWIALLAMIIRLQA